MIAGRPATIGEDFAAERGRLLPLPPEPFATAAAALAAGGPVCPDQRGQVPLFGAGPADRLAGSG